MENVIQKTFKDCQEYNSYKEYKKIHKNDISHFHVLLDYNNRYYNNLVDYLKESSKKT